MYGGLFPRSIPEEHEEIWFPRVDLHTDEYLRVASLSIALYDYIITLPAEWRFYRSQRSLFHMNLSCWLFILIRYLSVAVLILSNIGFFYKSFTIDDCGRYYIVAPIFKVLQIMVSQAILGVRAFNISRRSKSVRWILLGSFSVSTIFEWFTSLYERTPVSIHGNCVVGSDDLHRWAWLYYLFAMLYDLATLGISTVYLLRSAPSSSGRRIYRLCKMMLYDGLVYFVALTAVNIFNIILFRTTKDTIQSAGASLACALTWILSQKILIHLQEAAAEHAGPPAVIMTRHLNSARDISEAVRSQFGDHNSTDKALTKEHPAGFASEDQEDAFNLGVHVRVEQYMTMEYDMCTYERESYRPPGVNRDSLPQ